MYQTPINHAEYQKEVKTMTVDGLRFTIRDCQEALEAMPNGHKAGYYQDEIHYCGMELARRSAQEPKPSKAVQTLDRIYSNKYNDYQQKLVALALLRKDITHTKKMVKQAKETLDFAIELEQAVKEQEGGK